MLCDVKQSSSGVYSGCAYDSNIALNHAVQVNIITTIIIIIIIITIIVIIVIIISWLAMALTLLREITGL